MNTTEIIIVGTYVPNAGVNKLQPLKRLAYRTLAWDPDLYYYLNLLKTKYKNVIWLGDLNVIIKDYDTQHIKSNIAGATVEERTNIKEFMVDWIDIWDVKNNVKKTSLRATWGVHHNPLRLDYVICSKSLKNNVVEAMIDQFWPGSDHVPLGVKFLI